MTQRKYFIDYLRVLAFFLLILFHCAMPFTIFGWEIKNQEQSVAVSRLIWWLHQWRLPLLFFIAGVGTHFSLEKRSIGTFLGERTLRLLVPVLFAMFFTIPFQVYFEWLQERKISGSYAHFYPRVWEMVPYPQGALTWSHMWFVVYLFVFTLLLSPVFALFRVKALQRFRDRVAQWLSGPVAAPFLFLPLAILYFRLFTRFPEQQSLLDDWFLFLFSMTLVVYGYLLGGTGRFWATCEKYRLTYLVMAIACIGILYYKYWWDLAVPKNNDLKLYVYGTLNSAHIWLLILSAAGYAKRYLNVNTPFLRYANQAVYPFYILHQTIIVAAAYYVVQWPIPSVAKFLLLAVITFTGIWATYSILIRPFILTRILFGLKAREKKATSQKAQAVAI